MKWLSTLMLSELESHAMRILGAPAVVHGQRWCHMWGDWDAELFEMAMKLGLKPYWVQESHALTHFDLVPTKRTQAILYGAIGMEIAEWYRQRAEGTLFSLQHRRNA